MWYVNIFEEGALYPVDQSVRNSLVANTMFTMGCLD